MSLMEAAEKIIAGAPKMHPHHYAKLRPDHPAVIMAGIGLAPGEKPEVVTYRQLEERSNQLAHMFRAHGFKKNDAVAIFMGNNARYHEITWACQRSGLRYVTISSKLALDELSYIVEDSRAKMLIVSPELQPVVAQIGAKLQGQPGMELYMVLEKSPPAPYKSLEAERDKYPKTPIADQSAGGAMLYSSGSTGRPKGILRLPPLPGPDGKLPPTAADFDDFDGRKPAAVTGIAVFGWRPFDSIYLSPAPLYHAAPIGFTMGIHALGGTVIVMERFNEEGVLRLIDQYKCTTGQFVPTHFIRMLRLPDSVKRKYSVASLKGIFHAVAPCPVPVKKAMIDWLGPIVHEYYAGSESNGTCIITADDWIRKPGTVGKPFPPVKVHIWDEDKGVEITQVGQEGAVYFEGGGRFEYSNSPEKTKESTNKFGWTTLGDVGFLDADGYLFLTDRKAFMIISGGVNIYPLEIENALLTHPGVLDAAVVGAPDPEMGEHVVAVVQPTKWEDASMAFSKELKDYLRDRISHVKIPKEISFMKELPRHDTGKLYKKLIKAAYHGEGDKSYLGIIPDAPAKL